MNKQEIEQEVIDNNLEKKKSKFKIFIIILNIIIAILAIYGIAFSALIIVDKKNKIKTEEQKIEIKKIEVKKQKQRKIDYINTLDLETDSSIAKFVNPNHSFQDLSYIPNDLVLISGDNIIDSKGGKIKLKKIALENLQKLAKKFFMETKNNIVIVSGYRSYAYQKGIKDRGCPDNLCSKAGFSEHQSGLAIDIYSASSEKRWTDDNTLREYLQWFQKNAGEFGFHNTYQKGKEIDGYDVEPWHWRYVGVELAKYLSEKKLTFAEFYNLQNQKKIKEKLKIIEQTKKLKKGF